MDIKSPVQDTIANFKNHHDESPELTADIEQHMMYVAVSKVGGGTIGHSYTGSWKYAAVTYTGKVYTSDDYNCGSPKTHTGAALEIAGFVESWQDELDGERYEG